MASRDEETEEQLVKNISSASQDSKKHKDLWKKLKTYLEPVEALPLLPLGSPSTATHKKLVHYAEFLMSLVRL